MCNALKMIMQVYIDRVTLPSQTQQLGSKGGALIANTQFIKITCQPINSQRSQTFEALLEVGQAGVLTLRKVTPSMKKFED
jgi:hypothetical protein